MSSPHYPVLSDDEIARLRGACNSRSVAGKRDRAILDTLLGSAVRAGELRALLRTDVFASDSGLLLTVRKGKNDSYRHIPFTAWAMDSVRRWLEVAPESDWLFCKIRETTLHDGAGDRPLGAQMYTHAAWATVDKLARRADVYRIAPDGTKRFIWTHLCRHTAATRWLRGAGCQELNIREVQDLLGHKHVTTTQMYTSTSLDEIAVKLRAGSDAKTCPDCAELVKAAARVCRFCSFRWSEVA